VQLEVKRRQERQFVTPCSEYPFMGRIICGTCGRSVIQQTNRGIGSTYNIIWRCSSRISRCKTDTDNCAIDSRVRFGRPEQVFTQAWNLMVSKKLMHQASLKQRAVASEDALVRYRAEELSKLLDEVGHITEFDFPLSLKVLDRMELQPNEKLSAVFQAGVRITL
jgi:site-specific DNA recombinase